MELWFDPVYWWAETEPGPAGDRLIFQVADDIITKYLLTSTSACIASLHSSGVAGAVKQLQIM